MPAQSAKGRAAIIGWCPPPPPAITAPMSAAPSPPNEDTAQGFALALTAYLMWGFLPLYLKAVSHIPVLEVLAHRVIWSVPVALAVLLVLRRTADLRRALTSPRLLGMAAMTSFLVAANWGIYVWAIKTGQTLEAALGYFINPLFSVLLGALVLKERLTRAQLGAIAMSALAVAYLTYEQGRVPVVALGLMLSWGLYAYLKKRLPLGPNQGFALEVLLLLPLALGYAVHLQLQGAASFAQGTPPDNYLLIGLGLITAAPLMIYANAAKGLRLSSIGILQYIVPSMVFLTAVFWFGEEMGRARMIAFPMIWAALAIYTASFLRAARGKN